MDADLSNINVQFYSALYRIRRFEETILENFAKGVFFGTTHTCLGQEANAVGVLHNLMKDDIVFSNHRCHGHFLAYGGAPHALFAELMGKSSGVCGGRGGSQHLHWRNFYSNGVQGGITPIATGMALAEKRKGSQAVTIVFLGDGTLGEGVVYEALNIASLWKAPILYMLENNRIAQTTSPDHNLAGSISGRFHAFGIPTRELDSHDVLEIHACAAELREIVRKNGAPQAMILHTARFGPHSKGDDTRQAEEIALLRQKHDPVTLQASRISNEIRDQIERQVDTEIIHAYQAALADPYPTLPHLGMEDR